MNVVIIPARGGSKRIPRKNIKGFKGKPIIAYSIAAAKESGCFDRIIVSTDDQEIASVARSLGAETPFIRPYELSGDHAETVPVIKHATEYLINDGANIDYVCCIYATAPFVLADDLALALDKVKSSNRDYCFSVTSYPYPIQRSLRLDGNGNVEMLYPENYSVRSQDLEETFHDAGQFYIGRTEAWLNEKPILLANSNALILARNRVQDIDTEEDWQQAEIMYDVLTLNK